MRKDRTDYFKQQHEQNKARRNQKRKERYQRNKDIELARNKRWNLAHPEQLKQINERRRLRVSYGLTLEQVQDMRIKQNDCCAICRKSGKLHIDHDHLTGAVRALLCRSCNQGLGQFFDDPQKLQAAVEYLRRHGKT